MILVDSNILLDVIKEDPVWATWSMSELRDALSKGPIVINPVIYSELSVGYLKIEDLEEFVAGTGLQIREIPRPALFSQARHLQTTAVRVAPGRECCRISL